MCNWRQWTTHVLRLEQHHLFNFASVDEEASVLGFTAVTGIVLYELAIIDELVFVIISVLQPKRYTPFQSDAN